MTTLTKNAELPNEQSWEWVMCTYKHCFQATPTSISKMYASQLVLPVKFAVKSMTLLLLGIKLVKQSQTHFCS